MAEWKFAQKITKVRELGEKLLLSIKKEAFVGDAEVSEKSKEEKYKELARIAGGVLLKKLLIAVTAYFFGGAACMFDTYPLGIALLCAVSENILLIFIGLAVSALTLRAETGAFFLMYLSCLMLRFILSVYSSDKKEFFVKQSLRSDGDKTLRRESVYFKEPIMLRLASLMLCSLSIGLARMIRYGFLYYDIFGMIVSFLASPVVCLAIYAVFEKKTVSKPLYELSSAVIIFSVVYSLRAYLIFGFSAAFIFAYIMVLFFSKKYGLLRGCAVGLFAGLACELSYAPLFSLVGFVSAALYGVSLFAAVGAAAAVGLLYAVATLGFSAFATVLPEIAAASSVFLPLAYYDLLPKRGFLSETSYSRTKTLEEAVINKAKLDDRTRSIELMSDSLGALSETIAALSDRFKKPSVIDIKEICEKGFEKYCRTCSLAPVCYGKEAVATFDIMGKLTEALERRGHIDMRDVPNYMGEKCFNILKITSEINLSYAGRLEELIKLDKTSVFAVDYKAMSELLRSAFEENESEYAFDRECCTKLCRALRYIDLECEGIYVYGNRKKHISISGVSLSDVKLGSNEIRTIIENVCETRLSLPVFSIDEDKVTMTLEGTRAYTAQVYSASAKKENSESNGDCSNYFENKNDYGYFLISDGMGSGREAYLTSKLCSMFLTKLLGAGCSKNIVIEMLNGFLKGKNDECSATVDIAELDLLTGKGCFIKSGAAPSYILRNKNLYKIQSRTLPIGILRETDAEIISFELKENDIIIMFSDGVASSLEDGVWLTSLLCFEFDDDPDKMAKKILDRAAENNKKSDDMTVGIIKISKSKGDLHDS